MSLNPTGSATTDGRQPTLVARRLERADVPHVIKLQGRSQALFLPWSASQLRCQLACFPAGQLAVLRSGKVVGVCASIKLRLIEAELPENWLTATGEGYFHVHETQGNVLYVASMAIDAHECRVEVRRLLDQALVALALQERCDRLLVPVRLHGFVPFAGTATASDYIESIEQGWTPEPVVQELKAVGFRLVGVLPNHLNGPRESNRMAAMLEWRRPAA